MLFHIEAVGRVGSLRYSGSHHFKPVPHIVAERHIGAEFGCLSLRNREILPCFGQHLLSPLFVALNGQPRGNPRLAAFSGGIFITQHNVEKSVFLL